MRRQISVETWDQIKTAFASGIGLRELARNMGVSENTVLARARREKWTHQIVIAKQQGKRLHSNALAPMQSAALTMQQRAERYTVRLAGISERVLPHLESLPPSEILERARNVEQFDRFSRRNFGLDSQQPAGGLLNFQLLANKSAIQIIATESIEPRIG